MKKTVLTLAIVSTLMLFGCAKKASVVTEDNALSPGIPMPEKPVVTTTQPTNIPTTTHNTTVRAEGLEQNKIQKVNPYRKVRDDIYTDTTYEEYPEVIRYGRYTLVTSAPIGGQKYLLEQLVDVNVPVKKKQYTATVRQGLQTTLNNTGYNLCHFPADGDVRQLFGRPLPKVHYKFGSMRLRDALQMLVGEAFELIVDDTQRQVCFEKRAFIPVSSQPRDRVEADVGMK
ncbi:PFGI-1 class ICE element type IV pilus protein PilL2 [Rodentibacter haemolyticus]|uniref:PilL N-terminal domain-containing protein n=1 Tax=Rodentibacter haemolyticus TaxID=2778911 RepID=A0ABX6UYC6_9PAST|nr:PilL N-terminal domain-containing protein [Rodentibacter haemolyticus]QPB42862.1 PilL N-terminal domain-containing protein [Rodentibacter haemolyticus]